MPLISDRYRAEQTHLHYGDADKPFKHKKANRKYGTGGPQFVEQLERLITQHSIIDALDYGCGKGLLAHLLSIKVQCYDPAIGEYAALPSRADMVICLDVFEHIEPECLDAVLAHIRSVTGRFLFVSVSLKEAGRQLRDGRNAHLIVRSQHFWRQELERHGFSLVEAYSTAKMEWVALLSRKFAENSNSG